jgi:hypothetical protein
MISVEEQLQTSQKCMKPTYYPNRVVWGAASAALKGMPKGRDLEEAGKMDSW